MNSLQSLGKGNLALLRVLVKLNILDPNSDIRQLAESGKCPLAFFAALGAFDEEQALKKVAQHLQISYIQFDSKKTERVHQLLDTAPFSAVSLARWKEMRAVPFDAATNWVMVAFANPIDHEAKSALEFELGRSVQVALAKERDILALLEQKLNASPLFDVENLIKESTEEAHQAPAPIDHKLAHLTFQESQLGNDDAGSAPIVRLVNKIFADAVEAQASDIHVSPSPNSLVVRIRVDGIMRTLLEVPEQMKNATISRIKLLGGMDISEKRKPQDGRLRLKSAAGDRDLRISSVPTPFGENLVVRILASEFSRLSFDNLGVSTDVKGKLERALKGSSRVVLVSGPTGSGKSSTLYASILSLCDGTNNIITVEDPIEYRIPGVTQMQVNEKTGLSFAEGLRSILRQDPDVVMLGEIRDRESAEIAMQAAQTGHLVLSTIHTNTAAASITRLLDLGLPAYIVASSLGSVVAQRLVRKLCAACAETRSEALDPQYAELGLKIDEMKWARGCKECKGTGYKGRTGVYSFLEFNDELREAIRHGASEQELERIASRNGFLSLEEEALKLVKHGITSIDEVESVIGVINAKAPFYGWQNGADSSKAGAQAGPSSAAMRKPKILLVEDDEDTRSVLSMLLKGELFDVVEAANGYEGLEKVYEAMPELILCDLMMPKMDGAQMVERLRRDPRTKAVPVIMLTAADTEENEVKTIASGADDFISKTADTKVMLARIYRLLERSA